MDIGDRVRREVLSENLICHDLQLELDEVISRLVKYIRISKRQNKKAILNNLKSQLLKDLVKVNMIILNTTWKIIILLLG